jgi:SAM-dependent methyltransferase
MIANARHGPLVTFKAGDVALLPDGSFDLVYTQRCLINLPTWEQQHAAIDAIAERLTPRGRFLMCEHSQNGLDAINALRQKWDRPAIQPPWHNRYFRDGELATITSLRLLNCIPFSATYYFLSRVLNDKLAEAEGLEPAYDAKINQLALRLSADCVDPGFAQGRLWVWEKP